MGPLEDLETSHARESGVVPAEVADVLLVAHCMMHIVLGQVGVLKGILEASELRGGWW